MISDRLKQIGDFIPLDNIGVADIGSDHGKVLLYILSRGFKGRLLGVENKKGPYDGLKSAISGTPIEASLSDGLEKIDETIDTLIIAGMGFLNIKSIITENSNKLVYIKDIIVDSHNNIPECRKFFTEIGYFIYNEKIVYENNVYYEILHFQKGRKVYDEVDIKYGPILRKNHNSVYLDKYNKILMNLNSLLPKIGNDAVKKQEIEEEIESIQREL